MGKRTFDIFVSMIGLLLLALPLALIAVAIKITDGRPVFYRQLRIGRGARPFWLYKFRTMRSLENGPVITAEGDSRVTAIGQVLRRWKLDELPQLLNVLRGDMSVVGPRPEAERLVRYYTAEQRKVLEQTPGLASMAQLVYPHEAALLRGCSNPEEVYTRDLMPRKLAVDIEYERTRTFVSDLKLLAELVLLISIGKSGRIDRNVAIGSSGQRSEACDKRLNAPIPVQDQHL
jgi:lipopolysaccharide/colanic/teichoic acid biosynthesis glycosyltransferase